ncbi:MAG TPA: RNA polymerase sigma factor RpoD/SigA [Vicinamibacterales bacterium]|nr:RNA polymerase sigma factor RpoD/SigA [Vicinamibacterales bacterium]
MTRSRPADGEESALQAYLRELRRFPPTTPEEERELGRRIRDHRDEEAIRRLVEGNLRFVVSYAKRYRHLGVPFLDLIHEGNLGLIEAARRFDPDKNVRFITYAVWWVRQAILQLLAGLSRPFAVPARLSTTAARMRRDVAGLTARLERTPTTAEVEEALAASPAELAALDLIGSRDVSLNAPAANDENAPELQDTLEQTTEPTLDEALLRDTLVRATQRALAELDPREREIMRLRFGIDTEEPLTLQEIGDRFRLSRERVRQIEARAREKLRRSKRLRGIAASLN